MSLSRQHPRLEFLEPVSTHRYGFRVNSLRVGPAEVCPHAPTRSVGGGPDTPHQVVERHDGTVNRHDPGNPQAAPLDVFQ